MLKNYLKIVLRTLRRHPGYSAINVAGFAVGIAACLLIVLYVQDELLFDRYHANADRIYRVVEHRVDEDHHEAYTAAPLGPALVADLPEIVDAGRMWSGWRLTVKKEAEGIIMRNYYFADPGLIRIFDFDVLGGDPEAALDRPNGVVLTETTAHRLFGDEDPVGKSLEVQAEDFPEFAEGGFEVGAVIDDLPHNTHLDFDMLISTSTLQRFDFMVESFDAWDASFITTYVLAESGSSLPALNDKVAALNKNYRGDEIARERQAYLQPLKNVHFFSSHIQFERNKAEGRLTYVYLFAFIALIILLIACFNYTNMATARSVKRAKEVGLRKVAGARRIQLVRQFLAESFLTVMLAMILAIALVGLVLPAFNQLLGTSLRFSWTENPAIWFGLFSISMIVGLAAGGYPAFFLARYKPAAVLKGTVGGGASRMRQILVSIQFALSIALIAATLIVQRQLDFTSSKRLGFEPTNLVAIDINHDDIQTNFQTVKTELLRNASILNVTVSSRVPGDWKNFRQIEVRRPSDAELQPAFFNGVDTDFLSTYRIALSEGRNFDPALSSDSTALLLNETAARQFFPATSPIGQSLDIPNYEFQGSVVGVVKDFHIHSLHRQIEPLVMGFMPSGGRHAVHGIDYFTLRIDEADFDETLAFVKEVHARFDPINPTEYGFLSEWWHGLYAEDTRIGRVFGIGAGLAILIACIGLMGLAAFTAEQRTKEIGVRKVMGASVPNIVALLAKDFLKLVGLAFIVAAPLAYFGMQQWLEGFAYHVSLGMGVFAAVAVLVAVIAGLAVSYQSVKAATGDPVEALRYE